MKKKILGVALAVAMSVMALAGCGSKETATTEVASEVTTVTEDTQSEADTNEADTVSEEVATEENDNAANDDVTIRVAALKGPTAMGLSKLLTDSDAGNAGVNIQYSISTAADEITPEIIQGNVDVAAIPANLASVLYNKTEGQVTVLAINTLGVISIVDTGDSVQSVADLKGKTIYATGQGATPEYSLRFILENNGIDPDNDVTIEWKSEATEVLSVMTSTDDEVIAMLPQPFVTVAATKVDNLNVPVDFNEEWKNLTPDGGMVTGVVIARTEFVNEHPEAVSAFMKAYAESVDYVNTNVDEAAALIEQLDIVKAPIAKQAIPKCNITFIEGEEMKSILSSYLGILNEAEPKSIGGAMPGDDFYYSR